MHWEELTINQNGIFIAIGNAHSFLKREDDFFSTYFSDKERDHALRFSNEKSRLNHLHARVVFKELFQKKFNTQPSNYNITNNTLGAPEFDFSTHNSQQSLPKHLPHFSLSHTDEVALAVISEKRKIGCDVANVSAKNLKIIKRFSQSRHIALYNIKALNDEQSATLQWSAWEAASKINQQGFRGGFSPFQVQSAHLNPQTNWWELSLAQKGLTCSSQLWNGNWITICHELK